MDIKTIELCADDFGLNQGISEGIIELVRLKRLSAVSCMTNGPEFLNFAPSLKAFKEIRIGLHFNVTEGYFLTQPETACYSLQELLFKSHLNSLKLSFIAAEFLHQLHQFEIVMGCLPDFIDGHQHVHQLPIIRKVILDIYDKKLSHTHIAIRSTNPYLEENSFAIKKKVLSLLGGNSLKKELMQKKIPHNDFFAGIYDFAAQSNYRKLFSNWLVAAKENTLIMCHPGLYDKNLDAIAESRQNEFAYFSSNEFLQDLENHACKLG